jgi:hypothetical protein
VTNLDRILYTLLSCSDGQAAGYCVRVYERCVLARSRTWTGAPSAEEEEVIAACQGLAVSYLGCVLQCPDMFGV